MSEDLISMLKRVHEVDAHSSESKILKLSNSITNLDKRRKYAILLMYSGWGYYGMQKNCEFPTIEGQLLSALNKADMITEEHIESPQLIHFQRASRTDKNVSATGQICVAKLPYHDVMPVDSVNSQLPDNIRILDMFRVTKHFCPQKSCNHRVYQYTLPTFAFAKRDTVTKENCWRYRLSAELLTEINRILMNYKGTRNYFNFTSSRAATDLSCRRFIMSVECGQPFLLDCDRQFAIISIAGQSFMLHQIRKMVGLAIAVVSGYTTEAIFEKAFVPERLDIPKAPGLGLMLDRVEYTRYNEKMCADGSHQAIDWNKYSDKIEAFKKDYILDHLLKVEVEENSMLEWINDMDRHSFDRRRDGSPSVSSPHPNQLQADAAQPNPNIDHEPIQESFLSTDSCFYDAPELIPTEVELIPVPISISNPPVDASTDKGVTLDKTISSNACH